MRDYHLLREFLFYFAEVVEVVDTFDKGKYYKIERVDAKRLYVVTERPSHKTEKRKKNVPRLVQKEWLEDSFSVLIKKGYCTSTDLEEFDRDDSFLMAYLAALPFTEIELTAEEPLVRLQRFTTADLPEGFNNSMRFLLDRFEASPQKLSPFFKLVYNMLYFMEKMQPVKKKKDILMELLFLTVVSSTSSRKITESVAERRLSNVLKWLEEMNLIDQNLETEQRDQKADQDLLGYPSALRQFWWVNQGQSRTAEKDGGYLWAPKQGKGGTSFSHHTDLLKARPNDMVFAYANGKIQSICLVKEHAHEKERPGELSANWEANGYLLPVDYFDISPIMRNDIPLDWRLDETGPFDRNGNVKQGYFFSVSPLFVSKLYKKFEAVIPPPLKDILLTKPINTSQKSILFHSDVEAVDHIHTYIRNKGFYYEKDDIKNLYLSLKTKPFVILSGISGTGKTKVAQWFAESLGATEENGRFTLIAVRPDWSDGSDLLGYVDIKGEFQEKPLTKVLRTARENKDKPYFVLLDEMNLARVEYYFSDLLSILESRQWVGNETVTAPVLPEDDIGEVVRIPANVYFIGTVNMDETTYPFSKKVLDRANTIEFNHVHLDHFSFLNHVNGEVLQSVETANRQLNSKYLHLKDAYRENKKLIHRVTNELMKINEILQEANAHVGYRVRDDICFYMIYNEQGNLMPFDQAFDFQLLQKILPRLSGSDERIQKTLEDLYEYCTGLIINEGAPVLEVDENVIRFPKSAKKIKQMLKGLSNDGFTSFWL